MCVQVCMCARLQVEFGCCLLLSPITFETMSFNEARAHCLARLAASESLGPPTHPTVFASQSWDYRHSPTPCPAFYVGAGDPNSSLPVLVTSTLLTGPCPQPD